MPAAMIQELPVKRYLEFGDILLGGKMLARRDRARSGFGLFLTGSGFAERVVQSDVNVSAHDVIVLQFVSRLKVEFVICVCLLLSGMWKTRFPTSCLAPATAV